MGVAQHEVVFKVICLWVLQGWSRKLPIELAQPSAHRFHYIVTLTAADK